MATKTETKNQNFKQKVSHYGDKLAMWGGKIANQKHFAAIRDGFATFLPLVIVGALALFINQVFVSNTGLIASEMGMTENATWQQFSFYISPIFNGITSATMGLFSVYMAFLFGYYLTGAYGKNQLFGGLISLAAWFTMSPFAAASINPDAWGGDPLYFLGTNGLILAMFVGLTVPTVYAKFSSIKKLKISMPPSVPDAIAKSFNELIPLSLTLLCFATVQPIWGAIAYSSGMTGTMIDGVWQDMDKARMFYLFNAIQVGLMAPFMTIGNSPAAIFIIMFMVAFFWFFGVHGSSVMAPIINTAWETASIHNMGIYQKFGMDALDKGWYSPTNTEGLFAWTKAGYDSFTMIGGTGATLGLLILIFFLSRNIMHKKIAQVSIAPGLFNINEPVTFGLPIMLNPIWAIPYMFGSAVSGLAVYFMTITGFVNPTLMMVPWTTPFMINGYLTTLDPMSFVVSLLSLGIVVGFYLPFLLLDMKAQAKATPDINSDHTAFNAFYNKVFRKKALVEGSMDSKEEKNISKQIEKNEKKNKEKVNKTKGKSNVKPIVSNTKKTNNKKSASNNMKGKKG